MSDDSDDTTEIARLDLPVPPTVLIVDDDPLVLARLEELVTAAGYDVRTAASGLDALTSLTTSAASIVVTDLQMPGMGGLDLCRHIRERPWSGYVYVVLLTIRDEEKDILAGLDAGADDYVSKRTSAAQFTARLRIARRVLGLEYSLKTALEKKRQLAMTDALTGAYNRRYLMRHLGRELKRSQRFGGDVSLLLLDIDHFKLVNDTHGHAVGDTVLRKLTAKITACLRRETDWCARLGGEEFAVVLEGTNPAAARTVAETLRQAIADTTIVTSAGPVRITVSIGISGLGETVARNATTVQSLMQHADTNLYASKANGRNRVTGTNSFTGVAEIRRPVTARSQAVHPSDSVRSQR
ncbi:MAG: diguanylate cyclase [Steroidobacteraceae bacterium]|jgi:diguanylate cyclase (GGDEF)-like protein